MKPTEDWLQPINGKFRREDVLPTARLSLAISEYSKQFNCSWISPSDIDKTIENWFYRNTKPGSHQIGSLYNSTNEHSTLIHVFGKLIFLLDLACVL
jgi:hypothetical protein